MLQILDQQGRVYSEEFEFRMKSGEVRTWLFSAEKIIIDSQPCIISMTTDISERKKMEKALAAESLRRRILIEQSRDGIVILDQDGKVYEANLRFAEMLGCSIEEVYKLAVWDWEYQFPAEQVVEMIRTVDESGDHFETRHRRKDGSVYDVEISTNGAIFAGQKLIFCVCRDITERKKAEDELKQALARVAAANKELEAFSYSVSHDLRSPLRSIDGFSQALIEDYTEVLDKQGKEYLQRVQKASQHMGQLIDDMLKLSRLSRAEMTVNKIDLSEAAAIIIERFKKEEPIRKIDFIMQDNLIAEGDPNLLNILLENLLGNAWKFTKKCNRARIEFGKKQQNKETVFFIRDNGAGFDMKYANKLFIPFQRLHDDTDYPGTGIGLGIVSRIIHRHGGQIWAEAEENKGATFYFTLGGKINE